ncbi:MAG: hypothetical protein AB8F74_14770 [Saprospiraceae bacterium]
MRFNTIILLFLFNCLLVLIACSGDSEQEKKIDPMEAALPHGSALPSSELSAEDRKKLANANGIIATPIRVEDLVSLIDEGSQELNIYCLWRLDCPACDDLLESLTRLKEEIDPEDMAIHHINMNFLDQQEKVNSRIREMGLISNNYILAGLSDYENNKPYSKLFKSDLPVLLLVNNSEGIKLIYQKAFTFEELYALISPLTI